MSYIKIRKQLTKLINAAIQAHIIYVSFFQRYYSIFGSSFGVFIPCILPTQDGWTVLTAGFSLAYFDRRKKIHILLLNQFFVIIKMMLCNKKLFVLHKCNDFFKIKLNQSLFLLYLCDLSNLFRGQKFAHNFLPIKKIVKKKIGLVSFCSLSQQ